MYTVEQAREISLLSRSLGRQIGLLIDRRGRVDMVIVGKPDSIYIPELPHSRTGATRLRGLRLLHTHLTPDLLSEEDLMDMLFLRLDCVIALTVNPLGDPVQWQGGHLMPPKASKPYMLDAPKPWDQTETDLMGTALALEEELSRQDSTRESQARARAVVVSVSPEPRTIQERNLDELSELCSTAGIAVCGRMIQRVRQVNPKLILGRGKMAELEVTALMGNADTLVFDGELSPSQLHNLADVTERKVIDRTQLILDIFAEHAVSKAGKLQVELAQLKYAMPRLSGKNRSMDRLLGGIGGKGLGETKLELDRRRFRERMARLNRELRDLRRQRSFTRTNRSRSGVPLAALVGYTNAGKSTLLNTMTQSHVLTANKLFATLDTTTRRMRFPQEKELIVADTVGFIRKLPHHLVRAFRSTLDELRYADILVVLADASDSECAEQLRVTDSLIAELGAGDKPVLYAFNKSDLAEDGMALISGEAQNAVFISAKTGMGMERFLDMLETLAKAGTRRCTLHIPMAEQGVLNQLYRFATVEDVRYEDAHVAVTAVLDTRAQGMFKDYIV